MNLINSSAYRFVLNVAIGYFTFQLADNLFLKWELSRPYWTYLYHIVLQAVIKPAYFILKFSGFETFIHYDILWITGSKGVRIDNVCTGLDLIVNFVLLIGAYPGDLKKKLIVIPIGVVLIVFLNITRVIALLHAQLNHSSWIKYDFHYLYNIAVYVVIFIMWMVYVRINHKHKSTN